MNSKTKQTLQSLVERFNLSIQTHHHAIMLINMIYIKTPQIFQKEFVKIKKKSSWSNYSDSQDDEDKKKQGNFQSQSEYQIVQKQQLPSFQITLAIICTFLSHKLYEPYPLCINYMLRFLNINEKLQQYMISLEMEIMTKFKWKIQNLIPFSEALFVCAKWDDFTEGLSFSSVDVRFQINRLFKQRKLQVKTCHQISEEISDNNGSNPIQLNKYEQNYNKLRTNLQKLVQNNLIYEHIVKNQNQKKQIPTMRRIALSLVYKTIQILTRRGLSHKRSNLRNQQKKLINRNKLQSSSLYGQKDYWSQLNSNYPSQKQSGFSSFNYIFNDFLKSQFEVDLRDLNNQLILVNKIIGQSQKNQQKKSTKSMKIIKNEQKNHHNALAIKGKNYLIEDKNRMIGNRNFNKKHPHFYHKKSKYTRSISSTKTQKQNGSLKQIQQNQRCFSILSHQRKTQALSYQKFKNAQIQSTMGRSNESDIDTDSIKHSQKWSVQKQSEKSYISKKEKSVTIDKKNFRNNVKIITAFQILQ